MRSWFLLPLLVVIACDRHDPAPRPARAVILISIDTLRSDRLPAYGYRGIETPHIDAFRRDAILYQRAYSHYPLTLPSHATVFTGQLPAETGIRDNTGYDLADSSATLAELLARKGYATGAAVSSYVLRKGSGIERGFAFYDDDFAPERVGLPMAAIQRDGARTVEAAERWLQHSQTNPVFFFLHIYEPHTPYEPSYDGEIVKADAIVGRFFAALKEKDLYDDALIILFSDHGEGLGDHDEDEHGIFLYREAIEVPLLVKLPDEEHAGSEVDTPVQLSDIFPTVLAQTSTKYEYATASNARSLLDFLGGETASRKIYSETYFPRLHFGWSDLHSLIDEDHHYIEAPRPEIYATTDRAEQKNLLEQQRRVYAAMKRDIAPLIQAADAPRPVSTEEAAKLAALGYLGSAAPADGPLPDPKDQTGTFRDIRAAFKLFRSGEYEKALEFYQRLLRDNPRMLDLWEVSSRALVNLGRKDEAVAAAKEGLKIAPQAAHLAVIVASLSLDLGRIDDAEAHAELALKSHEVEARDILARVALNEGDIGRAEKQARAAVAADGESGRALVTLARVEHEKKNHQKALEHLDAATRIVEKKNSMFAGLEYLRGDVLARLGRFEEAEASFRKEIENFPEDAQSYKNLILLQVAEGRLEEATQLIHQLEKASPVAPTYVVISETLRVVGDQRGARFWAQRGLRKFPDDPALRRLAG
jgi:choline-sulfatase